jgi:hypothetical protein
MKKLKHIHLFEDFEDENYKPGYILDDEDDNIEITSGKYSFSEDEYEDEESKGNYKPGYILDKDADKHSPHSFRSGNYKNSNKYPQQNKDNYRQGNILDRK